MRVIAGSCRGRQLTPFTGRDVRPTPDRVREALFSILQSRLGGFAGTRVLDLFAGSGALAIEALSRGAASACLVEQAGAALRTLRENLERCRLTDRARVIAGDAWGALPGFAAGAFDLVFLDPPYRQGLSGRALLEIDRLGLLADGGVVCVEEAVGETLPDTAGRLRCCDRRRYGTIMLNFYAYAEEE